MIAAATEVLARGAAWGSGLWWPIFPLFWVLPWGLVIIAVCRFGRRGWRHGGPSAEEVLAERYARGEITVDEYRERLGVLKGLR